MDDQKIMNAFRRDSENSVDIGIKRNMFVNVDIFKCWIFISKKVGWISTPTTRT